MPLAPAVIASIIGGGASIAGGALASRSSSSGATTPTIAPEYKGLQDLVLQQIQSRIAQPIDTAGYTANGIASINRTADLAKQNVANTLAARGLSASPVAGNAAAVSETGRASDVSQFQNSIPLLVDQMQRQRLSDANSVLAQGRGTTYTGTQEGGGGAAGAFTNLASYLGYLQGRGTFKGAGSGGGNGLPGQMAMPGALGTVGAY